MIIFTTIHCGCFKNRQNNNYTNAVYHEESTFMASIASNEAVLCPSVAFNDPQCLHRQQTVLCVFSLDYKLSVFLDCNSDVKSHSEETSPPSSF